MTKLNQQLLFAAGPMIFKNSQVRLWGFECQDGWMSILLDLIIKLERRQAALPEIQRVEILQVKEKFGTLRFYAGKTTKLDDHDIKIACEKSATTCEDCGNPAAKLRSDGWMRTLCDKCTESWKESRRYEARN